MMAKTISLPDLQTRLARAVDQNELVLYYQPQVDLKTGAIVAAEALVRWKSPELGLVPPNDFIPLAEESGLIIPIGAWVLETACKQMAVWQKAGHPSMAIAVNLSARQFQHDHLVETIISVLKSTAMDPRTLDLEITETYAMQNVQYSISVLKELKEQGVMISIDDFGTGYSSLMHLLQFPIDTLKIDRFFIRDLSSDSRDAAIATAIITLAHNLGLQVVAEGVETEDQRMILCREGCDRMQGFLFSRPLPASDFEKLIQTPPISVD